MRVLVTGHRGYLGTVLTPMLSGAGHEVRGIDAGLFEGCAFRPLPTGLDERFGDIRDIEPGDLDGCDAVVHLAALSNDPMGDLDHEVTHAINHHAAVRVAQCARSAGVRRFVGASTCSVYGIAGEEWVDELTTPRPATPYAASKVRMERDLLAMHAPDFQVALPRFATAFGMSPMLRFDLVVNNLTAWGEATGVVRLKSDGSAWRPLIHTRDIARAILALLELPRIHEPVVNIGSPAATMRIADVAQRVADALPPARVETAPGASADRRSYRVRLERMARALPGLVLGEGVGPAACEIAQALRETPVPEADFEGPRFARVAHVRRLIEQGWLGPDLRYRDDDGPGPKRER